VISEASGEHWMMLQNVAVPTLTVFPPKGPATGTAVMVVPGGGYRVLAMDLEGSEICDWLTAQGITCALLKYRVPASGPNWDPECNCRDIPKVPMALQDAQRAMGLLRAQAERWSINPKRIGVIGFSAGGHVVAGLSTHALRSYAPVDAADEQPSRPDFAMVMYSGHLWAGHGKGLSLVRTSPWMTRCRRRSSRRPPTIAPMTCANRWPITVPWRTRACRWKCTCSHAAAMRSGCA
jgi:acetyl esterase/lipase